MGSSLDSGRKGRARRGARPAWCRPAVWLAVAAACATAARACNVPVFRFALERWVSDNYVLVVAHDQPLTAGQRATVRALEARSCDNGGGANLTLQLLDLKANPDDPAVEHLPLAGTALPAAFLFYPASFGTPTLVWQGGLTENAPPALLDSPARDDFVRRMLAGKTAVWVLLESGERAEDDRVEQVLRESLTAAEQELELPPGVVHPSGEVTGGAGAERDKGYFDAENQLESRIPLRISFDVMRLPRDSAAEDLLLRMLLQTAPGLPEQLGQPMVFPLFGRGRMLQPLVGREIDHRNIGAIAAYLCGPCSCQVKAQNPGVDMLLEEDWEARLAGAAMVVDRVLPPLSGTADLGGEATVPRPAPPEVATVPGASGGGVLRNLLWATAAVLVLLALATAGIMGKKR